MTGQRATQANFQNLACALVDAAQGFSHNSFKIELAKRAIVCALTQASEIQTQKAM